MAVKTEPGLQACVASKSTTCISGAFCFMESSDFQVSNPEVIVFSQERASGSDGRGICLAVDSAQNLLCVPFLCPYKKGTKENVRWEALKRSLSTLRQYSNIIPRLRATLPPVPPSGQVENRLWSVLYLQSMFKRNPSGFTYIDYINTSD